MPELSPTLVILLVLAVAAGYMISNMRKGKTEKEGKAQNLPAQVPFPQEVQYTGSHILPNHKSRADMLAEMKKVYGNWSLAFTLPDLRPGRIFLRWGVERRFLRYQVLATSQGQGYAMQIAAIFAGDDPHAQKRFDMMLTFCDAHPSTNDPHLVSWQVTPDATVSRSLDSASQGDILIAYALLMADRQWGSKGEYDYQSIAGKILTSLRESCVHPQSKHMLAGNGITDVDELGWQSSPCITALPHAFTRFMAADDPATWQAVSERMLNLLQAHAPLPPAVLPANGTELDPEAPFTAEHGAPLIIHLALAWLLDGNLAARELVLQMHETIKAGCQGDITHLTSEFSRSGTPLGKKPDLAIQSAMAVAAMLADDQDWLNRLWDHLATAPLQRDNPPAETLRLMALMLLSNTWWTA